jgi:hypothetical protein
MTLCALHRLCEWVLGQVDEGKSTRGGVLADVARPGCNIFFCDSRTRRSTERVVDAVVGFAGEEILWTRIGMSDEAAAQLDLAQIERELSNVA